MALSERILINEAGRIVVNPLCAPIAALLKQDAGKDITSDEAF